MKRKLFIVLLAMICVLCCAIAFVACGEKSDCNQNGHDMELQNYYNEDPTCTEPGIGVSQCTKCGHTEEVEVPALGHDEVASGYKEADCYHDGRTDEVTCRRCGETLVESQVILKGHIPGEVNSFTMPTEYAGSVSFECSRCGEDDVLEYDLPPFDESIYTVDTSAEDVDKYTCIIDDETIEFSVPLFKFGNFIYDLQPDGPHSSEYADVEGVCTIIEYYGRRSNVVIPAMHDGKVVAQISEYVFSHDKFLESVTLPEGMQIIWEYAFSGCSSLKHISMPDSIVYIDSDAFNDCDSLEFNHIGNAYYLGNETKENIVLMKYDSEITDSEIIIPDGTRVICDVLEGVNASSLTIPNSLRNLQGWYYNTTFEDLYFKGGMEDWCNIMFGSDNPMVCAKNFYIFDENGDFFKPEVIEIPEGVKVIEKNQFEGFSNMTFLIHKGLERIGVERVTHNECAFDRCENGIFFYDGTAEEWDAIEINDKYAEAFEVYYYQETEQTVSQYFEGLRTWHYNDKGEAEAWVKVGHSVADKTYSYSSTTVEVSDEYWEMLMEAKRNNMLEALFDNDTTQINMVKNSATKEEYVQKLTEFSSKAGADMTLSFANGEMTLSQNGSSADPVEYIELNGCVYVNRKIFCFIDEANGVIYEDNSNEHVVIHHIWSIAE